MTAVNKKEQKIGTLQWAEPLDKDSVKEKLEKVVLVRLVLPEDDESKLKSDLQELAFLTRTAGGLVLGTVIQKRKKPDPAYLIGEGKARFLRDLLAKTKTSTVIFDNELKPGQLRNLQRIFGDHIKILDRSALILDIFATHARTPEAKIQVKLAQLEYLLPRLSGMWRHLERQYGTIGVRGPGEKQLEMDRRTIRRQISVLRQKLKKVEIERRIQRKRRTKLFRISIVGYTNSGKTLLLNRLAGARSYVANKLFSTLDALTRRISDGEKVALITDTVGFIQKIPHHLIESFKSTLAETREADLLLIIADASHEAVDEHIKVVNQVLDEISAPDENQRLLVMNKVDLLAPDELSWLRRKYPTAMFVSALTGTGIDALKEYIFARIGEKNAR